MPTTSESSTHQLVGFVTKMFPTFGYINNEIFFQRKCVIGPMVEVGDNVATSAVYQPNMPIKWSAEKVWKVQDTGRSRPKDDMDEKKYWPEQSPRKKSPLDKKVAPRTHERESRASRDRAHVPQADRKRRENSEQRRSLSKGRPSEERGEKRRRLSPAASSHSRSSPRRHEPLIRKTFETKFPLNAKELLVPDLHLRFPSVLAPVDLYRTICHWQNSFPLLRPFQPDKSTVFQVLNLPGSEPPVLGSDSDTGFYVNVLLLSMPSLSALQEKTVIRAESLDRDKPPIRKYIKILTLTKSKERCKAIGGAWNPEVDGSEPLSDPQVLINTAMRICKEQIGLDLSYCSHWHRFLEFRYSRTEGSTARPTSVLFPGGQQWGRSFSDHCTGKSANPTKPFHKIVVYFLPDVWSLMPSDEEWNDVRKSVEGTLCDKGSLLFPLAPSEIKAQLSKSSTVVRPASSLATNEESGSSVESGLSVSRSADESTVREPPQESDLGLHAESMRANNDSLQSPTPSVSDGTDKESASQETVAENKAPKKAHDEMVLSAMKVSELREQLKARNLPADGIKAQLLSRLKAAVEKEAEQARKLEEERKKKEKERQEALEKEAEEKRKEISAPVLETSGNKKLESIKITLRNYPSIIVQQRPGSGCTLQTVSLDAILDSRSDWMDARSYELLICVHSLLDMIRRDSIFTLFRALVSASDRGVQAKARSKSELPGDPKIDRADHKDRVPVDKNVSKEPTLRTVDVPLLCACTFLDACCKGYFHSEEVEDIITTLGLPVSRYQLRSLTTKVSDGQRIYYRTLTDAVVSPTSLKSAAIYSEIDDDEYLLELVRGGDAILDEQKDIAYPAGSVLVLRGAGLQTDDALSESTPTTELSAPTPEIFAQHLGRLETERNRMRKQLLTKSEEIDRLRKLTDQIPTLNNKLASATVSVEDYRRKLRTERDRMHSVYRVLDLQTTTLDSTRVALRQAANRLRGREEEPVVVKKTCTEKISEPEKKAEPEQKAEPERKTDPEKKSEAEQESELRQTPEREEKCETEKTFEPEQQSASEQEVPESESVAECQQTTEDVEIIQIEEDKLDESIQSAEPNTSVTEDALTESMMDVSVSVVPLKSPSMVNGVDAEEEINEDSLPSSVDKVDPVEPLESVTDVGN
ncbi:hypothetical protein EG68_10057 [Paragonimus skrjabini miyazakii]|uniref:SAP domain-containing protein n=1 Tax=Paragonimus skrjabini miyazakii TaxID=59628 RepID=A0A8S9YN68_9TREM|nr:hypothetical protein EG68_10057 [Paragonimus skrjabini miyazakii]